MNTTQLNIEIEPKEPWSEILTLELSECGFDAFENTEKGIIAYGFENQIEVQKIEDEILNPKKNLIKIINYSFKIIPFKNWNEVWENDFEPVFIEDKITILAPFHDKSKAKGLIIEIQPQMSFGTGYHQTTYLMAKGMFDLKQKPSFVLDMGTGTGVLAILAEKLGAKEIVGIDIEDWSVENAKENAIRNNCNRISFACGSDEKIEDKKFDLILANINKNILKAQMNSYVNALIPKGLLMISGFFESDEMINFVENFKLTFVSKLEKETWAMLTFIKNN